MKDILVASLHPGYNSFYASFNNLKKALACSFGYSLLAPVISPCIAPLISDDTRSLTEPPSFVVSSLQWLSSSESLPLPSPWMKFASKPLASK
jgi:hypothetical protein